MTAKEIKVVLMCYWRVNRKCPIVATEYEYGSADVVAIDCTLDRYETEIKISIADLKRDIKKRKHRFYADGKGWHGAQRFYFAVPLEISDKAKEVVEEMYPYAGLIVVEPLPRTKIGLRNMRYGSQVAKVIKPARVLMPVMSAYDRNCDKVQLLLRYCRGISNTACRLGCDYLTEKGRTENG